MGLGLEEYSKFLIENGIKILAVANLEEAITLRKIGIEEEILMMTPILSKKELQLLIENDITITLGNFEEFEIAELLAKENQKQINAHIKVDTGFGRYGFLSGEKEIILEIFKKSRNVKITRYVYTFFKTYR